MIYEITPFTTLDYKDHLSCIAWFAGCNMRCVYCYNTQIVTSKGKISKEEFIKFLHSRVSKLNGVVLSGGECTLSRDFLPILKEAKNLGFDIKVDTNGTNLKALKDSINLGLVDYIALDYKATKENFSLITNSRLYNDFIQTLKFLIESKFKFEVRTTIHRDFLAEEDISKMANFLQTLGYKNTYYLQNFLYTGENFGCIENSQINFDPKKIKTDLKIELRNF